MASKNLASGTYLHTNSDRLGVTLANLNARIARLTIFVRTSIKTEADVQKIIHRENPIFQIRADISSCVTGNSEQHRLAHSWAELRGLLMMRSDIVTQMLNSLGWDVTEQITLQVDEQLGRLGFKTGANVLTVYSRREL